MRREEANPTGPERSYVVLIRSGVTRRRLATETLRRCGTKRHALSMRSSRGGCKSCDGVWRALDEIAYLKKSGSVRTGSWADAARAGFCRKR